jgi:hypothetical protein
VVTKEDVAVVIFGALFVLLIINCILGIRGWWYRDGNDVFTPTIPSELRHAGAGLHKDDPPRVKNRASR